MRMRMHRSRDPGHVARRCLLLAWACLLLAGISLPDGHVRADGPDWTSRVFKLEVTRNDGMREYGSAIPLAGERMVTNCHVLRDAVRIEVLYGEERSLPARSDQRDAYRDLCFLTVPGLEVEAMPMIELGQTRVGLHVLAVGYPKGRFAASPGRIIGLHTCECDGGRVIQTSAPFERGASGGGLFDREGRLVGILAFKAKSGGNFHFALPVGWLRHIAEHGIEPIAGGDAFWEKPGRNSGYFLAACDLGAKGSWRTLANLAAEWVVQEPNNPEAWMALGRARRGLHQPEAATEAFQRVLMLDSTHAEAHWESQQIEFELGRQLPKPGGI